MDNVYDLAHKLARAIRNSEEYKTYLEKKKILDSNEKNKKMVEDFRKKALKLQMDKAAGKEIDRDEIERINKLEEVLMLNPSINEFFHAELRFTQLVEDITKIISNVFDVE
ncbi:YlbF/YmcA family competence regulator [Tepidimicrobium xylanilyticum]|uniref:Cell fate regulator YlbF, YheA/YmcA/DUF963 family (Controls sporulation, competence, biofilm development) n=1 Tax=Tepidimicrobium xylanilyticum TaxID=1123352 RepID=A0A1H2SJF9_9FIRM|nr:YlbF family regulator [Tepidimicrobium xylanilyticum]GMG96208.1 UPF0342 protein [Tepidimicrobium xylanilyticum]SDW31264.1 Cell fate regulator YlbF, YheA/YmcA/DUF963 family (controls sporulation, competence, biofilm development) [Tepidimicrobium xylanilyticum]